MKKVYTTQEAARELHISEGYVRDLVQRGILRKVEGRGPRGQHLILAEDVRSLSVQRRAGEPDEKLKHVIAVDPRGEKGLLSEQIVALRVAGIRVMMAESVNHAIGMHSLPFKASDKPIIIVPALMEETEHNLARLYLNEADFIIVGYDDLLPCFPYALVVASTDLGLLVRECWRLIYLRRAQVPTL